MHQPPFFNAFSKNPKLKEATLISLIFFLAEFIFIHFHEMWRDEIQAWSIALNSHSLKELFFNSRYEGHPKLWFVLLFLIQKVIGNILYMRLAHIFIASSAVFVFCFYSPFTFFKNVLLCFGYFFFYEYGVISRNYSIELLLLFLCAGVYLQKGEKSIISISVLIFCLFQTNVYAVIIGIVFYGYVILNLCQSKLISIQKIFIPSLIVLSGFIISVTSMIPPADGGFVRGWHTHFNIHDFSKVISAIFKSYFPFPRLKLEFWNTNFTDLLFAHSIIQFIASILILLLITIVFYDRKNILLLFYAGTLGLLLFYYSKYFGFLRHHGQLFLLFILCFWLYFHENKKEKQVSVPPFPNLDYFIDAIRKYFLTVILSVNFFAAGIAVYYDIKYPFSNAGAVAEYLKSRSMEKMIIIGDTDDRTYGIAGLLNKKFYFPQSKSWSSYITWKLPRIPLSEAMLLEEIKNTSQKYAADLIVILSHPVHFIPGNWIFLKNFDGAIVHDENYFVYLVKNFKPKKE